MEKKHKWRVAIIMAHDGETYFEYNDLEQSILNQTSFDNLSYVIFYYNQKYQKTSIKELRPDIERGANAFLFHEDTKKYENLDFYKKGTLIKFLKEIVSVKEEADKVVHYMVITWGHGAGLLFYPSDEVKKLLDGFKIVQPRIIDDTSEKLKANFRDYAILKANVSFSKHKNVYPFLTANMISDTRFSDDKINEDLKKINSLLPKYLTAYTAYQLNEIFQKGLPNKIDIYFALNCYTQMLETGFDFKDSVKLMVASQTTIPIAGINYFELFKELEAFPGKDLRDVAKNITDEKNFASKYKTGPFSKYFEKRYPKFQLAPVSFSCNFLEEYPVLAEYIDELVDIFEKLFSSRNNSRVNINAISNARYNCLDMTTELNSSIIDLTHFLEELDIFLPNPHPDFSELLSKFLFQKDKCNASIKLATDYQAYPSSANRGQLHPLQSPLFLSIFAPAFGSEPRTQFLLEIYTKKPSEFQKNSSWAKFVKIFYRTLVRPV